MKCKFSKKELADLFFQMTNYVVDSENIVFEKNAVVTPANVALYEASILVRNLRIVVVTNLLTYTKADIVIGNTTGIPSGNLIAHATAASYDFVCLGFGVAGIPANAAAIVQIYSFR